MRTFVAWPPLGRMTGGLAVLANLLGQLAAAGHEVAVVPREPGHGPENGPEAGNVPVIPWQEARPGPEDIWLAPEGWPGLLLPGLSRRARTVIYVQNWAYLLGSLPEGSWPDTPVHLLAVSGPVAWHAKIFTGKECCTLRPGIDLQRFRPSEPPRALSATGHSLNIAWMPRKNKALAQQIQAMVQARCRLERLPPPQWVPIHQMQPDQVADTLRSCQMFLATGFPEGCPLPPLEAMASGSLVAGFAGFGGWDYMRQALPEGCPPQWPCPEDGSRPNLDRERNGLESGNGFFVRDADTTGAALAVEYGIRLLLRGGDELVRIRDNALRTAGRYSLEAQRQNVLQLWDQARRGVAFPVFLH